MTNIRVDPAGLRAAAKDLLSNASNLRNLAEAVQRTAANAPSYDGQFGPKVRSLADQASAKLSADASRLEELSQSLVERAAAFESADAANAGFALLKALVKGIPDGPARKALRDLFVRVAKNADEAPRFFSAAFELLKREDVFKALQENPRALAAVLDAGPEMMERVARHPEAVIALAKHQDIAAACSGEPSTWTRSCRAGRKRWSSWRSTGMTSPPAIWMRSRRMGLLGSNCSKGSS